MIIKEIATTIDMRIKRRKSMEKNNLFDKSKEYGLNIAEAMLYFPYCQIQKTDCAKYFDYLEKTREYRVKNSN